MLSRIHALLCLVILCASTLVHAADPSTTFTVTTTSTSTVFSPTVTLTSTTQLADARTVATTTTTKTVVGAITTVGASRCIQYSVKFDKHCCPKKLCHKNKGGSLHPRAVTGPFPTTAPCSKTAFMDFDTALNQTVVVLPSYDFGPAGGTIRVQDLYAVNVCGDAYIDDVFAKSTTCPARDGTADTNDQQNDPDAAINSGNFGYAYVDVPAGVHKISFFETYDGGRAYYQIISGEQCPALVYIDERGTTVTAVKTDTTVKSLAPTTTITALATATVTTAVGGKTVTVKAHGSNHGHPSVGHCKKVNVSLKCPRYKQQSMLDAWMKTQLTSYKGLQGLADDLTVTCVGKSTTYYY